MQHHLDEFSVTDIRHTIAEVWRVVSSRRWYFLFPFCLLASAALACSLWLPRQYRTHTIIKREHDPVFASLLGNRWTQPYSEIRQYMEKDLKDVEAIENVLDELGLPIDLKRYPDGTLTPEGQRQRRAMAEQVSAGLATTALEASAQRDIVSVWLTLPKPDLIPPLLARLRDRYIATARQHTVQVLQDVEGFFLAEAERTRVQLATLQKRMLEYEMQYPGVDPESPDRSREREAAMTVERVELERTIDDLTLKRSRIESELVAIRAGGDGTGVADALPTIANPEYEAVRANMEQTIKEIADGKTLRFMTEQHPVIQGLRRRLAVLQTQLYGTPERTLAADVPTEDPEAARQAALRKLEAQAGDLDAQLAARRARLAQIDEDTRTLERRRALTIEHRQDYLKLKQESARANSELNGWMQNVESIRHVLKIEDRGRTVHFSLLQDVRPIVGPCAPTAKSILVICLAIGAAAGVLVVLIVELMDRTYRTAKQLRTSLGIPVIEGIEEILSRAARQKRLLRRLVLVPAAAGVAIGLVLVTGSMAYLSIERPSDYELLKESPQRLYHVVAGQV